MCVHNAKRDDYLLVAAEVKRENKMMFFNPATGEFEDKMPSKITVSLNRKNARGRAKEELQANGANTHEEKTDEAEQAAE
jgi:hypothetical protein